MLCDVCVDVWCVLRYECGVLNRLRVRVRDVPYVPSETSACLKHAGVSEGTLGGVLNVHTGTRTARPPHTTHAPLHVTLPTTSTSNNGKDKQRISGRRDGRQTRMNDRETSHRRKREMRPEGASETDERRE